MKRLYTIMIGALLATLTLLPVACTPYDEVCYSEHPHVGNTRFAWDWLDEVQADSMMVLAIRPTNLLKYGFSVNVTNDPTKQKYDRFKGVDYAMWGKPLFPGENQEYTPDDILLTNDVMTLHEGLYDMLTFNTNGDAYTLNYDYFRRESKIRFDSMTVVFNTYDKLTEHPDFNYYRDWADRNPYSTYLLPTQTIYYSSLQRVKINNHQVTRVKFPTGTQVSQLVTFVFYIDKKQADMRIDRIRCEISGVPKTINPFSYEVDKTKTYKTLFRPNINDRWDNTGRIPVTCTVPLLGIVRSPSEGTTTGPGVLQVELQATYRDANGKIHGSNIRVGYNLHHKLFSTPSIIDNDKDGRSYQAVRSLRIELNTPMEVNMNGLQNTDPGFDDWQQIAVLPYDV